MRYPVPARWRINPLSDVHDGDTIRVYVDCGGINEKRETWDIRLKDVWAPELEDVGGIETRDFVRRWVNNHGDDSEWPFLLETFQTPRSDRPVTTLGRYVGVITSAGGSNLNDRITAFVAANGYAGGTGS